MTYDNRLPFIDSQRRRSWLTLLGLFVLLLALGAVRPLALPDEGRYGAIGFGMLQTGDWMVPRINGIPFFHKPPLTYWFEAASMAIFGTNEWALRLTSAVHACLMLLTLYLTTRTTFTEAVAYRALLIFGTSLTFLAGGQYINHDMVVAAWITVAISCIAMAFMNGDRPHINLARIGFVACALGVLSKGLIGIALPGMVLLIWLIWTRQLGKIRYLPWFSGLFLFSLIALPWFVFTAQKYPDMLTYLFGAQQFSRYTSHSFNNVMPWWFYIIALLILIFPWALFALYQAKIQIAETKRNFYTNKYKNEALQYLDPHEGNKNTWLALCWIWLISIFAFFSVPNTKIIGYIIPIILPATILAAIGFEAFMKNNASKNKIFVCIICVNVFFAVALTFGMPLSKSQNSSRDIARILVNSYKASDTVYAFGGYPYDLAFYIKNTRPLIVIEDWAVVSNSSSDNWKNELLEGSKFDLQAKQVLQTPEVLNSAKLQNNSWLVAPKSMLNSPRLHGWKLIYIGQAWLLFQPTTTLLKLAP